MFIHRLFQGHVIHYRKKWPTTLLLRTLTHHGHSLPQACSHGCDPKLGSKINTCFLGVIGLVEIKVKLEKKGRIYSKSSGHMGVLEPRPDCGRGEWEQRLGHLCSFFPGVSFASLCLLALSSRFIPKTGVSRSRISQMELIGPDCLQP